MTTGLDKPFGQQARDQALHIIGGALLGLLASTWWGAMLVAVAAGAIREHGQHGFDWHRGAALDMAGWAVGGAVAAWGGALVAWVLS